jgi:two-component system sensor histidine kinase YesM
MKQKKRFRSRIARKITRRMFLIYFAIYFLILVILLCVLTPRLYDDSFSQAESKVSLLADEFANLQGQIEKTARLFYSSADLASRLKEHKADASGATKAQIELLLTTFCSTNEDILGITIETAKHDIISAANHSYVDKGKLLYGNEHYVNTLAGLHTFYFSPIIRDVFYNDLYSPPYYNVLFYSTKVAIDRDVYCITLFYNAARTLRRSAALYHSYLNGYLVLSRYDELVYSEGLDASVLHEQSPSSDHLRGSHRTTGGVFFYELIPSSGWTVVSYASYALLLKNLLITIAIITALYLISPILYGAFLVPTTRKQLAPIKQLSDTMSSYSASEPVHSTIETDDEIGELSDTFNLMLDKIAAQIEDIGRREHENAVVNYKLLATQIDPHFIYNTMNIINITARQDNMGAVIDINSALVKILQERLNTKLTIYDTVQNEVNTLRQYELIMGYRYGQAIAVRYDIDDALLQMKMPRNILQPLVENAFYHGFSSEEKVAEGNIDILMYAIGDSMIIEVSDDGKGIAPERLEQITSRSYSIYDDKRPHIGLDNIRQRLAYIYKGNYQMDIRSTTGHGTNVIITIPLNIPEDGA